MEFSGVVVRGDGYGRKLGYPTANLEIPNAPHGVFAARAVYDGAMYDTAVFVTPRRPHILEAHLLDFDGDLYGKTLDIKIHKKIREAAEFEKESELKTAIAADIQKIRDYFSRVN